MWTALRLKYDEAEYFLAQVKAHTKHPRLLLFYLNAFLSSARSLTFHIQKTAASSHQTTLYHALRNELLSDELCRFFIESRNQSEKEKYLSIQLLHVIGVPNSDGDTKWTSRAGAVLYVHEDGFNYINKTLDLDWDFAHASRGASNVYQVAYRWRFLNFPSTLSQNGTGDLITTCDKYLQRLWKLIVKLIITIESKES